MRIIDKNYDFYDYFQDYTDTIVFDRSNSILLTKEMICLKLDCFRYGYYYASNYQFILLQSGATYWLCLVDVQIEKDQVIDYTLEVLKTWKNYNKTRHLLKIDVISFPYKYRCYGLKEKDEYRRILNNADILANAVDYNDYNVKTEITTANKVYLLKASGFNNCINPQDLFCAIEEHLSLNKTEAERTEPLGATNNDKIVMHGFDTKKSFRK